MRFYPAIKQLTLDLAADSFIGLPFGTEADRINTAFVDMVQASIAPIRRPLPFTQMKARRRWPGLPGRVFHCRSAQAARAGRRQDMFSQFATATDEYGELLPIDEVVDHMNFLMMAAHDTITSRARRRSFICWPRIPNGRRRCATNCWASSGSPGADLAYEDMGKPELTEMAFKEALRLIAPVPSIPETRSARLSACGATPFRRARGSASIRIWYITWRSIGRTGPVRSDAVHAEKVKARHKYAWVPFGGGAHMCLGLHFAYMQTKILMAHLLTRYRVEVEEGYDPAWQAWPIPQPKGRVAGDPQTSLISTPGRAAPQGRPAARAHARKPGGLDRPRPAFKGQTI